MAISPMTKIALIVVKDDLDAVLLSLQAMEGMELSHLSQEDSWRVAFKDRAVSLPDLVQYDGKQGREVTNREALLYLLKREQKLTMTIETLKTFLPKKSFWQTLGQAKKSLSFTELEEQGKAIDQSGLLKDIRSQLKAHQQLSERISSLTSEIAELEKWSPLDVKPSDLTGLHHVQVIVGTIPNTADDAYRKRLMALPDSKYQQVFQTETEYGILLFLGTDVTLADLDSYGFTPFDYPFDDLPKDRLALLQEERAQVIEEKEALEQVFSQGQDWLAQLELQLDYVLNLQERESVKKNLATTQHLVAIEGWVEKAALPQLKKQLIADFGDSVQWRESDLMEDQGEVPIKLRNHPLIEPFELVTEMYALPKYYEKDPTPILALFYSVFFGMMVADLGYGLLMILATAFALKFVNLNQGQVRFMRFFNILGYAVAVWGLVYGSFFGFELPVKLISTTTDVMTILTLSVAFGFVTVLVGLFLGGCQKLRMRDKAGAYTEGFAWCMILIGVLFLVLGNFLPHLAVLTTIGPWLAIINVIGILAVSIRKAKGISGLGSGLFNLYNVSGYVGDLVSFTRLMALGLSGASIGSAFNMIVGLFPPLARFSIGILMFILLHGINIFLSLLSGYVHGARLMFVEFFGKFYEGGGRAFKPLKSAGRYIKMNPNVHLEEK